MHMGNALRIIGTALIEGNKRLKMHEKAVLKASDEKPITRPRKPRNTVETLTPLSGKTGITDASYPT